MWYARIGGEGGGRQGIMSGNGGQVMIELESVVEKESYGDVHDAPSSAVASLRATMKATTDAPLDHTS